ncbi:MAG: alpha/beta fold hydrolase [Paracoccaceae bacterium]
MKSVLSLTAIGSLVLLAGCVVVDRRADARAAAAQAAFPPDGRIVDVDGTGIHAVQMGAGSDVVLIHGASGNTRDWTFSFAPRLAERYRVTVFDRPGMGYSDRLPGYGGTFESVGESPAEQAAILSRAATLLGVEDPVVVGHSYGGSVAMAWGLDQPARAVVTVAGATNPWEGGLGALYRINGSSIGGAILPPILSAFVSPDYIKSVMGAVFRPQPVPDGYAEYFGGQMTARVSALRANARQVESLRPRVVEMSARYDDFPLPLEIVHGDDDTIVPLDVHGIPLSRMVPDANLTVLEGMGHMPHHWAADEVIAAIDRAHARGGE